MSHLFYFKGSVWFKGRPRKEDRNRSRHILGCRRVLLLFLYLFKHANIICEKVQVTQSCLTLCNPMDYTVHGILQARILELGSLSLLQEISPTQGSNPHYRWIFYQLSHKESPRILEWVTYPFSSGSSLGIEPGSSTLQADSLPTELWGKPCECLSQWKVAQEALTVCFTIAHIGMNPILF